ncbi:MAG: hypothetical protein K2O34_10825 [Acetatifactor sp.]|nr:hypothetical protein [Acetatifactor sp.]
MRRSEKKIKLILSEVISDAASESSLQEALRRSRQAFYENEAADTLSDAEFLYQQSRYIHKRWWLLQACVLMVLWYVLKMTGGGFYIQRYLGVAASLFAILVLPEMWKNRSAKAMELESAAYYSLRQVYAARIFLFALVDFALLCGFFLVAVSSGVIGVEEMLVQFFLPYIVTCCICFKALYSHRIDSEAFALLLCIVWSLVWLLILSDEKIYGTVTWPVWCAMLSVAVIYLGYCIRQGQRNCEKLFLVRQYMHTGV